MFRDLIASLGTCRVSAPLFISAFWPRRWRPGRLPGAVPGGRGLGPGRPAVGLGPSAPSVVTPAGRAGRGASLRPGGRQGFRVRLRSRSRARVSAIGGEGRVCKCVHSCRAKEVRYSGVCTEAEGTRQGLPGRPSREVISHPPRRAPAGPAQTLPGPFPELGSRPVDVAGQNLLERPPWALPRR